MQWLSTQCQDKKLAGRQNGSGFSARPFFYLLLVEGVERKAVVFLDGNDEAINVAVDGSSGKDPVRIVVAF